MSIKQITAFSLLYCLPLSLPVATAEKDGKESGKEIFSALAYLPTGLGPAMRGAGAMVNVTIYIDGYSSEQDAQLLRGTLIEGGSDALLKALEKMKPIGRIERTGTVGFYDFKFIRSIPTDSGRRIIAVTDRPISFVEVFRGGRSRD